MAKNALFVRLGTIFSFALLIFALAANSTFAQEKKAEGPTISDGEAKMTDKLQKSKDIAEQMKIAGDFIKKYPKSAVRDQVAKYMAAQVGAVADLNQKQTYADAYGKIFTNPGEPELLAATLIDLHVKAKRYDEAFQLANDYLARTPEDVQFRLILSTEGTNLARTGNAKFAPQSREYALKAIELIEANKKPADISDAGWKDYQTKWLPQLYQSVGILDFAAGNRDEARKNLEKSAQLAPRDVNNWILLGSMLNEDYQQTAKRYTIAEGAQKEELLKTANQQLDKVIEYYARVVALTDGNPSAQNINKQIREDLENYYKYRHKSTDGMQAMIDKYKTQN